MSFTTSLIRLSKFFAWRKFVRAAKQPEGAYDQLWKMILRDTHDVPFWKKRLKGAQPLLSEQAITEYADYKEELQKGFELGYSPLSKTPVCFWALTGGTSTAVPKRFPLNKHYNRQIRMISNAYLYSLASAYPNIPLAPALTFNEGHSHPPTDDGIPVGYISRHLFFLQSKFEHRMMAIPRVIYDEPSLWPKWAPLYAVATPLCILSAVNPMKAVRFFENLLEEIESYWPYLEGAANPPAPLPPVSISRRRLAYLKDVFARDSISIPDVWPTLPFISCWSGAVSALQLPLLEPYLNGLPVIEPPYLCTEAWFNVPLYDGQPGFPLHPSANIIEFLPVGLAPEPKNLCMPWELEVGHRYELILTTRTGLIRYRLHDVVECHGFFHRTPRIAFCHKTIFVLRLGDMGFPEDELGQALQQAGYSPEEDLMVGPNATANAFALYLKAGSVHPDASVALDTVLREMFPGYDESRDEGLYGPIESIEVQATHSMWDRPKHMQSKSRIVLPFAPEEGV